jgi:phenylalanyl-tRNA synthetase beta chain
MLRRLDPSAELTVQPHVRDELVSGQAAKLLIDDEEVGLIGAVAPSVREAFDLGQEVTVAELDIAPLLESAERQRHHVPLARFPAVERDLSIFVDPATPWARVEQVVRQDAPPELEAVGFVERFHGKQVPSGKVSFTLTLRYRDPERTLTHEEVDAFVEPTVERLSRELGAQLREK